MTTINDVQKYGEGHWLQATSLQKTVSSGANAFLAQQFSSGGDPLGSQLGGVQGICPYRLYWYHVNEVLNGPGATLIFRHFCSADANRASKMQYKGPSMSWEKAPLKKQATNKVTPTKRASCFHILPKCPICFAR